MKGVGDEATSFYGARTESIAAGCFHPTVSPVPRAVARGHMNDGSPDHPHYLPSCAS